MDHPEAGLNLCSRCGFQMPQTAAFCPGCGRELNKTQAAAKGKVGYLPENVAGGLAYLTFVPPVIFLLLDPYRRSSFVRFHSVQCLVLGLVGIVLVLALKLAGMAIFMIPILGPLLVVIIDAAFILAALLLWLVLIVKALQGETFMVPWVGDVAERYATPAS